MFHGRFSRKRREVHQTEQHGKRRCCTTMQLTAVVTLLILTVAVGIFLCVLTADKASLPPFEKQNETRGARVRPSRASDWVDSSNESAASASTQLPLASNADRDQVRTLTDLTEAEDSRLGRVQSVDELRAFCSARAPQLQQASWVTEKRRYVSARTFYGSGNYPVHAAPVCVDIAGNLFLDGVSHWDLPLFAAESRYRADVLSDDAFKHNGQQGHAVGVPAVGLFATGMWIDTHIWHLVLDCIGVLMMVFLQYNKKELFTVPTQTILMRDPKESWIDRYGDTPKKNALSALVLNGFSSPKLGGPFFPTSPVVIFHRGQSTRSPLLPRSNVDLEKPLMHCYCQGIAVSRKALEMDAQIDPEVYHAIEDVANIVFDEDDYLTGYSFEETDRRRRASHPWASQFWNESTFDVNGTYRPRALVIHRQSRLIGNYDLFVDHLRKLNFRVEEIFPERLPLEQQYHLGRYADLLVGMHGLGVAHGFWMDRFPIGCRTVVEFRPWVHLNQPIDLYRIIGRHGRFNYFHPIPIDVTFGDTVANKEIAKRELMNRNNIPWIWTSPQFTDQVAYYDVNHILQLFNHISAHLGNCLPKSETTPRHSLAVNPKNQSS